MNRYILITPAYNEEAHIERTIGSVLQQEFRPEKWVIVDDASSDHTAEIVRRYACSNPVIELVNVERDPGRSIGNKARAFNEGLERVRNFECDFIGNLDADITLDPDYFRRLISEFERDPKLGLAGGMIYSRINNEFVSQNVALDSVAGAVQLFRRKCYEQTGGYVPLPYGGIDSAVEVMARMAGWNVRTFPELRVLEHRRTGSASASPLKSRFNEGKRLHSLGYGLLFFTFRCCYRLKQPPPVLGSGAALAGYLLGMLNGDPVALEPKVVQFLRNEQRAKLARLWRALYRKTF